MYKLILQILWTYFDLLVFFERRDDDDNDDDDDDDDDDISHAVLSIFK